MSGSISIGNSIEFFRFKALGFKTLGFKTVTFRTIDALRTVARETGFKAVRPVFFAT